VALALAPSYATVLAAAALMGIGSAVFHPESSRVARHGFRGQHGMPQSLFQSAGNAGLRRFGPLLAAFVLTKDNRVSRVFVSGFLGIVLLANIGRLDETSQIIFTKIRHGGSRASRCNAAGACPRRLALPAKIALSLAILVALMFSKFFYLASLMSYYTFLFDGQISRVQFRSGSSSEPFSFSRAPSPLQAPSSAAPWANRDLANNVIWLPYIGVLPFPLCSCPTSNLSGRAWLSVISD